MSIPLRDFGSTGVKVSALGLRRTPSGRSRGGKDGARDRQPGHRRRRHLLRQLLGISSREIRRLAGQRAERQARQSLPDDQGLHAWPRQGSRHEDAGGIAAPAADRSSRSVADPRRGFRKRSGACSSARMARRKRWSWPRNRAKCASPVSPATKIPNVHMGMLRTNFPFDCGADAAESVRRHLRIQLRTPGAAGIEPARHRGSRYEAHRRHGRAGKEGRGHARRSCCDTP